MPEIECKNTAAIVVGQVANSLHNGEVEAKRSWILTSFIRDTPIARVAVIPTARIGTVHRITSGVSIPIPASWVVHIGATSVRVWRHKPAHAHLVIAILCVIEAGRCQ